MTISLYIIFFLSGVAGLGYQMVWTRMFAVGLGHEMPSVLAVVAAFFGGLAIGAWLLDGPVSRSGKPAWWYVILELIIGLWGLLSMWLIPWMNELALELTGIEPTLLRQWLVAFSLPLVTLLPATISMGATLPAMERVVCRLTAGGKCVGGLYGVNTLGAVVGTLISVIIIIPALGYSHTLLTFACLNLICAAATINFTKNLAGIEAEKYQLPDDVANPNVIYLTVFFTGLLGIGYEVLIVRNLSQVFQNTVYSYAFSLSVYLFGTAAGAGIYHRYANDYSYRKTLTVLLYGLCLSCCAGLLVLSVARTMHLSISAQIGRIPAEIITAAIVLLPSTMFMGATCSHLLQAARRERKGLGIALSINTLGGALAPVVFGVALMPLIGSQWSLTLVCVSYLLFIPDKQLWNRVLWLIGLAVLGALPLDLRQTNPLLTVIDYREGVMASTAVTIQTDGNKHLRVNNHFSMGGTHFLPFERREAIIPLMLHHNPKNALFLGLGTGITIGGAVRLDDQIQVDGVELVPEIVELMPHFEPFNMSPTTHPNINIYIADARRFVQAVDRKYDVIVADLFHPARDGAGTLYTIEHFQAVRGRLSDDGLFCQWLPLYQLDEPVLQSIIRTFLEVFPETRGYLSTFEIQSPALGLVGRVTPTQYTANWLETRKQNESYRAEAKGNYLDDELRLLGTFLADSHQLHDYASNAPLNTDEYPLVIFNAPDHVYQRQSPTPWGRLILMLDRYTVRSELILDMDDPATRKFAEKYDPYITARDLSFRGMVEQQLGNEANTLDLFIESIRSDTNFIYSYGNCMKIAEEHARTDPDKAINILHRIIEARPGRREAKVLLQKLLDGKNRSRQPENNHPDFK